MALKPPRKKRRAKELKPSFFKNQEKRVRFRGEVLKRAGVEDPIALDSFSELKLSPVEIVTPKKRGVNLAWFLGHADIGSVSCLLIDTMNKRDKTITVKIHLDRQEEEIIQDIKFLIKAIKREARWEGANLSPLKPQWDAFDKCFKVYDLRKRDKKKWREIADIIFPGDKSLESAKGKVRSLYRKAEQMIKEEGERI